MPGRGKRGRREEEYMDEEEYEEGEEEDGEEEDGEEEDADYYEDDEGEYEDDGDVVCSKNNPGGKKKKFKNYYYEDGYEDDDEDPYEDYEYFDDEEGEEEEEAAQDDQPYSGHIVDNSESLKPITEFVPQAASHTASNVIEIRQKNAGGKFVDKTFTLQSNKRDSKKLGAINGDPIDWQADSLGWKHLSEIQPQHPPFKIYDDNIHPNDIVQGKLGSCFFLSAISALAERPALIKRLFEGPNLHPSGAQAVWLYVGGVWRQQVIDEYFVVDEETGNFGFASGRNGKLYISMLEKAYAKAFGCYEAINGGMGEDAIRDLTGAPYEKYSAELRKDPKALWALLEQFDRKGYLMVTGITKKKGQINNIEGRSEVKLESGLFAGHEYSLIGVATVTGSDGKPYKLVQVRNPWGEGEWKGLWNDSCKMWTAEARARLGHKKADDGLFWIEFSDFCKQFDDVVVCKFEDSYHLTNISRSIKFDSSVKSFATLIHVRTPGEYHFTIDHPNCVTNFEEANPQSRVTILRLFPGGAIAVASSFGENRAQSVRIDAEVGTYIALVDVMPCEAPPKQNPSRQVVFSSYGVDSTSLQFLQLNKKQITILEYYGLQNWASFNTQGWKHNPKDSDDQLVAEERNYFAWDLQLTRYSPATQGLKFKTTIAVDPKSSCDNFKNAGGKSLTLEVDGRGLVYTKTNDDTTQISLNAMSGKINPKGLEELSAIVMEALSKPTNFNAPQVQ